MGCPENRTKEARFNDGVSENNVPMSKSVPVTPPVAMGLDETGSLPLKQPPRNHHYLAVPPGWQKLLKNIWLGNTNRQWDEHLLFHPQLLKAAGKPLWMRLYFQDLVRLFPLRWVHLGQLHIRAHCQRQRGCPTGASYKESPLAPATVGIMAVYHCRSSRTLILTLLIPTNCTLQNPLLD